MLKNKQTYILETRDQKLETENREQRTEDRKPETGSLKSGNKDWCDHGRELKGSIVKLQEVCMKWKELIMNL